MTTLEQSDDAKVTTAGVPAAPQNLYDSTPPPATYLPPTATYLPPTGPPPPTQQHLAIVTTGVKAWPQIPCQHTCQYCGHTVTTEVRRVNGGLVWLIMGTMALFGCWLFCCLIPLCIPAFKDVEHSCPHCKKVVGRYERLH